MNDTSIFQNYSKKFLALIIKRLLDNNFEVNNPYEDDKNFETFENAVEPFGDPASDIDMEFFAKLIDINEGLCEEIAKSEKPKKSLYDALVIPKIDQYRIYWKENGSCSYTNYYREEWSSYDQNWVEYAKDKAHNDGNYSKYESEFETEYDNYEPYDETTTDIEKISESKSSSLDKLISENATYVIDSLDRKSLLILKSIIDKKLGF